MKQYYDLRELKLENAKLRCVAAYSKLQQALSLEETLETYKQSPWQTKELARAKAAVAAAEKAFYVECEAFGLISALSDSNIVHDIGTEDDICDLLDENEALKEKGFCSSMFDLERWGVEIRI